MRKGLFVFLSLALVVALAVPAAAEVKLTGFYRVKPTTANFPIAGNAQFITSGSLSGNNTGVSTSFVEMRNRLRFEVGDENVKGITFFELDGNFGDTGGQTGRNQGFASNGDSINLETKNAYIWFKIPDTGLTFQVGLQNYMDEFAGLLFGASDQAGVVVGAKFDPVGLRFTWFKLRDDIALASPGTGYSRWTGNNAGGKSADYYAVDAKFSATPVVAITGHFGFINDRGIGGTTFAAKPTEAGAGYDTLRSYYVGANATVKVAPVTLTGFVLYNFGQFEGTGVSDVKIGGIAGDVRADVQLGPGNLFGEVLYVSGDDDTSVGNDKFKSIVTGSDYANLTSYFGRPDLLLLFPNFDMINSATALVLNPNNGGKGLILGAAGFSMKFAEKVSGKVGAGYLAADKKRGQLGDGKGMGTEINANVNYNITKGLDFGVYAAYALLGDFYSVAGTEDPDDLYLLFGRLNYAF